MNTELICPCGSKLKYQDCCGRFIDGGQHASTALELMRSRYSAFALSKINYIGNTMRDKAAVHFDYEQSLLWSKQQKWLGLKIIDHGDISPTQAYVEFIAYYRNVHGQQTLHEKSLFHKIEDQWYYVEGDSLDKTTAIKVKLGRNDPCPCGSSKKYKKCCGR